jgi:predicted dienelactone hydrolase
MVNGHMPKEGKVMSIRRDASVVLLVTMLLSCATPAPAPTSAPTATVPPADTEVAAVASTSEPPTLPLSEPGPYRLGVREFSAEDASRDGRKVGFRVWYPAVWPEGESNLRIQPKAEPDRSGAPYPLILSSAKFGSALAPLLASHGFVYAGVTRIDTWDSYDEEMIDQPLDILFLLDQVATNPPADLMGMIDAERSGVTGYSFDGYNALALSGARIDPGFYLAQCASPDPTAEEILSIFANRYQCALAADWEAFAAHAGEAITASEDGLWQPMTDERIQAAMPLAGEGWLLFGPKGLAAVDLPTLILVSTEDLWYSENGLILEHLGAPDKAMISFVGQDHMMVYNPDMVARMAHFAVAFFGYHLQGREDLAPYYSEEFVSQHGDLAWGVYEGE